MAKFSTWSGNFGGDAAGANGKDTTLTLSSGRALTSSDQIKNITFTLRITCSRYSSSKTWDLHWFAVDSSTGSPYATPTSTAMSAAEHTFSGKMKFDASDTWKFFYDEITVYAKANTTHNYTSFMREATITVEYETASLTVPGAPIITQHETNGTFSANWDASTGSNGSGEVNYVLYRDSSVWVSAASTNSLSGLTIPDYDNSHDFYVVASYSGVTKESDTTSAEFEPPQMDGPTSISISPLTGSSVTVSWPPATLSWTAGTIVYRLWYKLNSTSAGWVQYSINDTNLCSITIDDAWFEQNAAEGDKFYFQVDAWASNISNNATGEYEEISSGSPLADQPFTYDGKRTVAYYNGSQWVECTIHYYDGSKWQECIPYYYDGQQWVELKAKL